MSDLEISLSACSHFFKRPGEEVERNETWILVFQKERSKYSKGGEECMEKFPFILSYPTIFLFYQWGGIFELCLYKTFSKCSTFEYLKNINYNNHSKVISTTEFYVSVNFLHFWWDFYPICGQVPETST